jgi:hypothetical protein
MYLVDFYGDGAHIHSTLLYAHSMSLTCCRAQAVVCDDVCLSESRQQQSVCVSFVSERDSLKSVCVICCERHEQSETRDVLRRVQATRCLEARDRLVLLTLLRH